MVEHNAANIRRQKGLANVCSDDIQHNEHHHTCNPEPRSNDFFSHHLRKLLCYCIGPCTALVFRTLVTRSTSETAYPLACHCKALIEKLRHTSLSLVAVVHSLLRRVVSWTRYHWSNAPGTAFACLPVHYTQPEELHQVTFPRNYVPDFLAKSAHAFSPSKVSNTACTVFAGCALVVFLSHPARAHTRPLWPTCCRALSPRQSSLERPSSGP